MSTDAPDRIYLEPGPPGRWDRRDEGRLWCEDDDPNGDGEPWVEYVRADHLEELQDENARLRLRLESIQPDPIPPDGSITWRRAANGDLIVRVDAPDIRDFSEALAQVIRGQIDP